MMIAPYSCTLQIGKAEEKALAVGDYEAVMSHYTLARKKLLPGSILRVYRGKKLLRTSSSSPSYRALRADAANKTQDVSYAG
jgi:hypothetical protein